MRSAFAFGFILLIYGVLGKGCEPLDVKLYIDEAITSDNQIKLVFQFIENVAAAVPGRSSLNLTAIGYACENIATLSIPVEKNDWRDRLEEHLNEFKHEKANTISYKTLDSDLLSSCEYKSYSSKAELVAIFSVPSTKFEIQHSLISKKKTVVVILGNVASPDQKRVASREDHVFVIPEPDDIDNVTKSLIKTICKDSKFYCDTDHYSLRKGSKCKSCSENVCSDGLATANTSGTCKTRCPCKRFLYVDYKTPAEEIKVEPESNYESLVQIKDHKSTAITAILTVSVILTAVVTTLVIVIIYRRRNRERIGEGEDIPLQNRQDESINNRVIYNLPDSVAQQETGETPATEHVQVQTDEEVGEASGTQHGYEPTDEEVAATFLKNDRERKMNETALEPPVYDIHESANLHPL